MRVISGRARGLKLLAPDGLGTRPTTDRVKESVFNILMPYIPCENVLDLFSGSGAMGIEALSRGCKACVFVEKDKNALDIIHKNLEKARFLSEANVIAGDALDYLKRCKISFNLIFLDPPYNMGLLKPVFDSIYESNLLKDNGVIVVETEALGETVDDDRFTCIKSAKYGKTVISVYKRS